MALTARPLATFARPPFFTLSLAWRTIVVTVSHRGAWMLSAGRDMFDRYVSDRCPRGELITRPADKAQDCAGYACEPCFE